MNIGQTPHECVDSRADPRAQQCFDIFWLGSSSEDSVLTATANMRRHRGTS
jgi:hypothetical protein